MQTNWIDRNSNVYNIRFCAIWSIFVNSKNSTLIANWHAFVSVSDKIFRQIAHRYYSLVKIGLTVCQNDQYSFFKKGLQVYLSFSTYNLTMYIMRFKKQKN